MTYDRILASNEPLKGSIPQTLDLEMKESSLRLKKIADGTRNKHQLHKRSQSYNYEFTVGTLNKSKVQLCISGLKESASINKKKAAQEKKNTVHRQQNVLEEPPMIQIFFTYLCYTVLRWFGNLREFLRGVGIEKRKGAKDNNPTDFVPLYSSFENFFMQNFYMRGRDCFNRPICSVPGAEIDLVERKTDDYNWTFYNTGEKIKALNMGSYNYLGFAENSGACSESVKAYIKSECVSTCSSRQELGTTNHHIQLEKLIAKFLNTESSLIFGMGFATNAVNIPALVDKNCLIMSDELNHTSLILGSRLSGATVKVFKHNDPKDLELKLKKAIVEGHPLTKRPWKKVLIVVEGIYSMEGTILNLPEIIAIKKKYKAYLYLDEAHSIGALGVSGRGICEYWDVDVKDVDVLMGTFSKSFGANGGYIAGSNKLINYLKQRSHAQYYASSMSTPICVQITKALSVIMGLDGTNNGRKRIRQLQENSVYFREKLIQMGFIVYGNKNSPIVPVMFYLPTKCLYFNRLMLEMGIAVVSVGFPATSLVGGRVRFCISAAHTREMLDRVLQAVDVCGGVNTMSKISQINPSRTFQEVKDMESEVENNQ